MTPKIAPASNAIAHDGGRFHGHLHLTAAPRQEDGRTHLIHQSFRAPFHLGKPYWDGQALNVQMVNSTAGILSGDDLEVDIRVQTGAALRVGTPAAARAFMMTRGGATCRQCFAIAAGGALEHTPEPLCPHSGCNFVQRTSLHVDRGAEVFFTDTLAPGRVARGEAWAWRRLRLALDIRVDGEPVLREALDCPGSDMMRLATFHGTRAGWLTTIVLLSPQLSADSEAWKTIRRQHGRSGAWVGVSTLRNHGWIIRAVLPDGQATRDFLERMRSVFAALIPILRSETRRV